MGTYDLQRYISFLGEYLQSQNFEVAEKTDRATRIQDTFLYLKEANNKSGLEEDTAESLIKEARARKSLHKAPKSGAPRYDKRSHSFETNEAKAKRTKTRLEKVKKSRKQKEASEASDMSPVEEQGNNVKVLNPDNAKKVKKIIEKADKVVIPPPKGVSLNTKKSKIAWLSALEKTASAGELITNSGKPNYNHIMKNYFDTYMDLNESIDKKAYLSSLESIKRARKERLE